MAVAKSPSSIAAYVPTPETAALRREIEEYYAGIIPEMRLAFARYVYKQGNGALAPTKDKEGRQESWQAVGRRLYGPEFMKDLQRVVREKSVVAEQ